MRTGMVGILLMVAIIPNREAFALPAASSSPPQPIAAVSGGSVFNPFPLAGASAPLTTSGGSAFNPFPFAGATPPLTPGQGSPFNPFPVAGAAAPLSAANTSVFNPFSFAGATAPTHAWPREPIQSISRRRRRCSAVSRSTERRRSIVNPEPASSLLLLTDLLALMGLRRLKRLGPQ